MSSTMNLPEPSQERLPRSPLQLVVCQVRHEPLDATQLKDRARRIRAQLGDAYRSMVPGKAVGVTINASPEGVEIDEHESWHLVADGVWTAVIANEFFSLETTDYLDWDDFVSRFELLAAAVARESDLAVELRLGLRYVDRLTEPPAPTPAAWADKVRPAFSGPLAEPDLATGLIGLQGIAQFASDGRHINVRFGCVESQGGAGWDYLLDHDCFREQGLAFSLETVRGGMEELHTLALQVFQRAVTDEYFEYLRGVRG